MEGLVKKQGYSPNTRPQPAPGLHKCSHAISKTAKPKIRIIHIFAPEIIKTDASNFRELVQRLTGKPTNDLRPSCKSKLHAAAAATATATAATTCPRERIKGEEEIWNGANSGGEFLGGFGEDFEECGFMQELSDHDHHHHLHLHHLHQRCHHHHHQQQYMPCFEATAGAAPLSHYQMDAATAAVVYGE